MSDGWSFETRQIHAGQTPDPATGARAAADLPDDVLRLPRHRARREPVRAQGARQHLHADHEPDPGRRRAAHRRASRAASAPCSSPAGRPPRRSRSSTSPRRATTSSPARASTAARTTCSTTRCPSSGIEVSLRRRPGRPRVRGAPRSARTPRRSSPRRSRNPQAGRPRHRGRRRRRARGRRPADRRQHRADAVPDAPARVGRRHRRPLGDQVPRRPRHGDRRRDRRRRHVRLRARTRERFPDFNEPDPSYHGLVYARDLGVGSAARRQPRPSSSRLRVQLLRDLGPAISPFNAFLLAQGIETLCLRIERHVAERAGRRRVARGARRGRERRLRRPAVAAPGTSARRSTRPAAPGAVLAFEIKGGVEAGQRFVDALELHSHVANIGDVRSLVIHPASTTHSQLSAEEQLATGRHPRPGPARGRHRAHRRHPGRPGGRVPRRPRLTA